VLCCAVLCCAVLCCAVLCCAVLCCAVAVLLLCYGVLFVASDHDLTHTNLCGAASGALFSWGSNDSGQLGLGVKKGSRSGPTEVPALLDRRIVYVPPADCSARP
jgi:hypothetical protein